MIDILSSRRLRIDTAKAVGSLLIGYVAGIPARSVFIQLIALVVVVDSAYSLWYVWNRWSDRRQNPAVARRIDRIAKLTRKRYTHGWMLLHKTKRQVVVLKSPAFEWCVASVEFQPELNANNPIGTTRAMVTMCAQHKRTGAVVKGQAVQKMLPGTTVTVALPIIAGVAAVLRDKPSDAQVSDLDTLLDDLVAMNK